MALPVEKLRLRIYLAIFISVLVVGTFGYMLTEGLSFLDAFYFTIVTIATVGYGDIAPTTAAGKVLDVVLIVTGVGTFVGLIANATESFVARRDSANRAQKRNMLIGLFFSEFATELLRQCVAEGQNEKGSSLLNVDSSWDKAQYQKALWQLDTLNYSVQTAKIDFSRLHTHLSSNRELLLQLLESPYILEHEQFTDTLLATLHLKEELEQRPNFTQLPAADFDHLAGDIQRVYQALTGLWIDYMAHLQSHYPYLFSLAQRTSPFAPNASAVIAKSS